MITTEMLCEEISHATTLTEIDVKAVLVFRLPHSERFLRISANLS